MTGGAGASSVAPGTALLSAGADGAAGGGGSRYAVLQAAKIPPTSDIVASRSARWMDFTGSLSGLGFGNYRRLHAICAACMRHCLAQAYCA